MPAARYPFPGVENYPTWPAVQQLLARAQTELAVLPGVDNLALAQNQPLQGGWTTTVTPEYLLNEQQPEDETTLRAISPGYLQTVGVPLLSGHDLSGLDRADAPPVVLANQAFVRRWYPDQDPIRAPRSALVEYFALDGAQKPGVPEPPWQFLRIAYWLCA